METADLKKSILSTVVYYDGLNYPLTAFEIWKYLISLDQGEDDQPGCSLIEVLRVLEEGSLRRWIEMHRGFYFLRGRQKLVRMRIRRGKISASKIKKLRRIVFWMRLVPFLRMVALTGRLAMKNAEPKSDWDVLVVLQSGRIWIGRTLVTLFAELLGKRRKAGRVRDRICLNYFITEKALEISHKDLFSSNEYSFILPLWGEAVFRKFHEQNGWIRRYRPNFFTLGPADDRRSDGGGLLRKGQRIGEWLLGRDRLESFLGQAEKRKIESNPLTHVRGSLVSASDQALIFLPHPQGPAIFEKFRLKIDSLLIGNRSA